MGSPALTVAARILSTACPNAKTFIAKSKCIPGTAVSVGIALGPHWPASPARPASPTFMEPSDMPSHNELGMCISSYLLHGLAHIELNAVDMYADTLARGLAFVGEHPQLDANDFVNDFLSVIADEARHFGLLQHRLQQLGSFYGAMPARTWPVVRCLVAC